MKLRGLDRRTITRHNDALRSQQRLQANKLVVPEAVKAAAARFTVERVADEKPGVWNFASRAARRFARRKGAGKDVQAQVLTAMRARRRSGRPLVECDARGRPFVQVAEGKVYLKDLPEYPSRRLRRERARGSVGLSRHDELMRRRFRGITTRRTAYILNDLPKARAA